MLTLTIDKDFEMLKALLGTLFLKHFGGPAKVKVKPVTKDSFMFIWLPARILSPAITHLIFFAVSRCFCRRTL